MHKDRLEFIEVNYTILSRVVLLDQVIYLAQRHLLSKFLEGVVHLSRCNFVSSIYVKHREHTPQLLVVEEGFSVDGRSQELRVIDLAIASVIQLSDHRVDLIIRQVKFLILDVSLYFICVNQTSPVQVKSLELFRHL